MSPEALVPGADGITVVAAASTRTGVKSSNTTNAPTFISAIFRSASKTEASGEMVCTVVPLRTAARLYQVQ